MAQNTYKNKPKIASVTRTQSQPWFKKLFPKGSLNTTKRSATNNKSLKSKIITFLWKFTAWFFGVSIALVVILKFLPIWFTPTMLDRKFSAIANGDDSEINYEWMPYEKISKEAGLAVVAAEDQFFPEHYGFDFKMMMNAFKGNLKGKKLKGASTITQQVAKNVFLWQGRSYLRKGLEAYFTMLIEVVWGKKRILEVYLNVAETGKMTFGFEEGSQKYYGHSASALSRTEAAKMAAVLPNPVRFSVTNSTNYIQRRANFIARQMRALGGKTYLKDL
jgi:monofunctional glycosyltransferase